jgi:hypothetical protein
MTGTVRDFSQLGQLTAVATTACCELLHRSPAVVRTT